MLACQNELGTRKTLGTVPRCSSCATLLGHEAFVYGAMLHPRPWLTPDIAPAVCCSQASELVFGDAWLFRAPRHADTTEVLAMLGQPEGHGCELSTSHWDSDEACARELAPALGVTVEALLSAPSDDGEEAGEDMVWSAACEAMQNLGEQVVLLIGCDQTYPCGLELLGRLVGCVANAHIASQVMQAQRGNVTIVLHGWADDKIEADWSDEEPKYMHTCTYMHACMHVYMHAYMHTCMHTGPMRNPTSFASRRCTESCAGRAELHWEGGAHRRCSRAAGRVRTEGLGLGAGRAVHQAARDRAAWENSHPPGTGGRSKGGEQQHQGQQPQGQPLSEAAAAEKGCSTRRRHLRAGGAQASGT